MAMESGNSALSSSMTDLMTSLAVIFILLLVATLNNAQQEGETTRNAILQKLLERLQAEVDEYKERGFEVKNDPKDPLGLIVVVPDGLLNFQVNRSEIPAGGIEFLQKIIPKMATTLCSEEFRHEMESIVIEGHTDSTGSDERNLPLSQERSLRVVQESLRILNDGSQDRSCFLELLSATGRGSVDRILDQEGKEDLNRSRRVIFKIRVRSLERRIVKEVIGDGNPPEPAK
ncbi:MAG: OmpA family protein [Blastocatellia bacterium]|nr:OmpA family protein [Blastocatellia bacterium]